MNWKNHRSRTLALAVLLGLALALAGCMDAEESGEPTTEDQATTDAQDDVTPPPEPGGGPITGNATQGDGNESEGVCVNNTADPYENPCPGEQDRDIPALEANTTLDES